MVRVQVKSSKENNVLKHAIAPRKQRYLVAEVCAKEVYRKWLSEHEGDRIGARRVGYKAFLACLKRTK